ncbi:MAG: nucleotidyltransferase [Chloroflexi bacterium]|nr:MAG: nucleotidyltransferase [Chloroflexota bacterium]
MPYAVILAGGYGKRLRPLTLQTPKPLLRIAGKPILHYIINYLKHYGIDKIIICISWLALKIIKEFGTGERYGISIVYSNEGDPRGTAGALRRALELYEYELKHEDHFYVLNADVLTDLDLRRLGKALADGLCCIAAVALRCPYGVLSISDDNYVTDFIEKPVIDGIWINAGIYAMRYGIIKYLPERGSLERDVFPALATKRLLRCIIYEDAEWLSIDTHKDLEEAEKQLPRILRNLGRDLGLHVT